MNWMILTDTQDKENVSSIIEFLSEKKTKPLVFEITSESVSRMEEFCKYLMKATHCVFITEESTTLGKNPFLLYAAGFLSGKGVPSFVSKILKNDNKLVLKSFEAFDSVKKLVAKLEKNYPVYLTEEAKKTAHKKLFDEGIPFTPDSFSFHIAKENEKICNLFVEAGMDVNSRDAAGTPMICIAARSGRKAMIEWLLSKGADINAVSKDRGYSAVMDAVWKSSQEIVKFLIDKGANLNFISNDGQSALIVATGASNPRICELLVKNGADPTYKDRMGMSSLDYARLFKKTELAKMYEEYIK
ncbi:MAG: ankyrin repeat domain-containing protein [Treponemataceae bacterium]|nr:ankyrin repeat domain-containing protein [Treponemataceae bacterium]